MSKLVLGLVSRENAELAAIVSVGNGANHFVDNVSVRVSTQLGRTITPITTLYVGDKPNRTFYWPDSETEKVSVLRAADVIVLEDVINKYTNSLAVSRLVRAAGGHVVGIVAAITRENIPASPDGDIGVALVHHPLPDWEPSQCYLCPEVPLEACLTKDELESRRLQKN